MFSFVHCPCVKVMCVCVWGGGEGEGEGGERGGCAVDADTSSLCQCTPPTFSPFFFLSPPPPPTFHWPMALGWGKKVPNTEELCPIFPGNPSRPFCVLILYLICHF